MEKSNAEVCREKLVEFFYPFIGNVELGNISASEATHALVDAFIHFSNQGWLIVPKEKDYQSKNSMENDEPPRKDDECLEKISNAICQVYRLE